MAAYSTLASGTSMAADEDDDDEPKERTPEQKPQLPESLLDRKLFEARTITIFGEINQALAEKVVSKLLALSAASEDPIKLIICSQGGHVEAGDAIHDFIHFVRPRVIAIGTGWVASAGAHIFLGAAKANRFCLPNTRFLLHQPLGTVMGRSTDIDIEAREIIRMRDRINRIIARETGQSLEKIERDTDRNFWIVAEEAVEYGIVSRVIQSERDIG